MQQEKCLPGIFIILHCSIASINELISGLDRELSTALAAPLGTFLAHGGQEHERNSLWHTGAMTLQKMTIIFWPLKQQLRSGLFY